MKLKDKVTAVILAGGKGERLRPITESVPKPLVTLNGKPILEHLLRYLAAFGVRRFVLCTGYKAEMVAEFAENLRNAEPGAWDIHCVDSGDATMVQRLRDAWPLVEGRALVCYGDTLANVDLGRLYRQHTARDGAATMTVYRLPSPYGIVKFDGKRRIVRFEEKPLLPHWINIGFMMCDPTLTQPVLQEATDMVPFLEAMAAQGQLTAYKHLGKHLTVNTEKERQQAEIEVVRFFSILES
jgi:glucose-1-phosphate cytidylyltransferase